ncbi:MAG: hypothetical protein GX980_08240 [Firmicutes bacterium]|nr:hypothetical protein [Bacillota bacterium]
MPAAINIGHINCRLLTLLGRLELETAPEDSLLVIPIPEKVANQVVAKNLMTAWHRQKTPFLLY